MSIFRVNCSATTGSGRDIGNKTNLFRSVGSRCYRTKILIQDERMKLDSFVPQFTL
jgi:hypothetical protein